MRGRRQIRAIPPRGKEASSNDRAWLLVLWFVFLGEVGDLGIGKPRESGARRRSDLRGDEVRDGLLIHGFGSFQKSGNDHVIELHAERLKQP